MKRNVLLIFAGIGLIAVLCAVLFAAIFGGTLFLTQPVVDVSDAFLQALQENRLDDAYALLHPALQGEVSLSEFRDVFAESGLSEWSFSSRAIENGVGRVAGSAQFGAEHFSVQLELLHVDGEWRINAYDFSPQ